ncbi:MAG: TonB family protein [Deltaproteobacteria bacterium]|nr:TonB family protein [Deltaproteobacteria bacterium]
MRAFSLGVIVSTAVHIGAIAVLMALSPPVQDAPIDVVEVDFSHMDRPFKDSSPSKPLLGTIPKRRTIQRDGKHSRQTIKMDRMTREIPETAPDKGQAKPPVLPIQVATPADRSEACVPATAETRGEAVRSALSIAQSEAASGGAAAAFGGHPGSDAPLPARGISDGNRVESASMTNREGLAEGSENYRYIRDAILKNLRYPERARRLGLEGKVLLSFVVLEDGTTSEIKVLDGSRHRILDESARDAVAETRIARKVPYRVVVRLPVTFRLHGAKDHELGESSLADRS